MQSMNLTTPEQIVEALLENDFQGPPAPDNFLNAVGSLRNLRVNHRKADALMFKTDSALQFERQLRKHGLNRDQIREYVRAESAYPRNYVMGRVVRRGAWPADTIVGVRTNDGQEIMFDMPILPDRNPVDIHGNPKK
jgi:hypothetical protein